MSRDNGRPTPFDAAFPGKIVGGRDLLANHSVARGLVKKISTPMEHRDFGATLHLPDKGVTVLKSGNTMHTFIVVGEEYAMVINATSLNERYLRIAKEETNTLSEFLARRLSGELREKSEVYSTKVLDSLNSEPAGLLPAVVYMGSEEIEGVTNTTYLLIASDAKGADIVAERLQGNLVENPNLLFGLPEAQIAQNVQDLAKIPLDEHRARR